jgi:4-amino-4-deoxy-L-arabinose transferase-like glycosyltransferase
MKKRHLIILLLTLVAGFLRFYKLGQFPVSPNWDELSHGYNAYSLFLTGKDEWGVTLPTIFRAFGDYKLPVYIYFTIIPIAIFGLNVFAIRFISALAGTLAIPGIYLLTKELFPEKKINLKKISISLPVISSFILTFLPWHFFISRPALEANLALTLIIYGSYFLIKGLKYPENFIPASVLFGLSLHSYNTARVFVPALLFSFVLIFWRKIKIEKSTIFSFLILVSFGVVVVSQMLSGVGTARYSKLNIITESTAYTIGQQRIESNLPPTIARFAYNRPLYFINTFIANYFSYFTPGFINQSDGAQFQFAIPGRNLLGFPAVTFFIIGVLYLSKNFREKQNQFILIWLLISPIAAALTVDPPQALRPNPLIPAIVIIAGLGLVFVCEKFSKIIKLVILSISIILTLLIFSIYLNDYFITYPKRYSQSWQHGYREVFEFLSTQKDYTNVFITKRYGEAHIFYLFFNKIHPSTLNDPDTTIRYSKSDWFWVDKIGSFYFVNDYDTPVGEDIDSLTLELGQQISTHNSIFVTTPDHVPTNADVLKTIFFLDGYPAFVITRLP